MKLVYALSLKAATLAFGVIALLGFGIAAGTNNDASLPMRLLGCVVAGAAGVTASSTWRYAKQVSAISADELRQRDTRQPVLYLRPFDDDAATTELKPGDLPMFHSFSAEDEHLKAALSRIGPVILINNPGGRQVLAGGGTSYRDEDWQEAVRREMKEARLVVLRTGTTPGLLWEFAEALKLVEPKRLMLLVPRGGEYEAFREKTSALVRKPLPSVTAAKSPPKATILNLIYFSPDWSPASVSLAIPKWRGETLTAALIHAMPPVYAALGEPWRPAPLSLSKLGLAAYGLLFAGAILYAILAHS